ncbi:hypothetical protein F5I97DRAFT_1925224 [Phlebopus sp. FC_14]|nr:hypothetical protein F5I97DRAFT_1925224 [Phlebopus sp. FC_14]
MEHLPRSWNDPSPLEHEPLLSYCSMMEHVLRSETRQVISGFVKDMQENKEAAEAAKKWVLLMFGLDNRSHEDVKVLDGGKELYSTFFEFYRLFRDSGDAKTTEYRSQVTKRGLRGLKINLLGPAALLSSTQTTSGLGLIAWTGVAAGSSLRPGHVATGIGEGLDHPRSMSSIGVSQAQYKHPHTRPSKKRNRNAQRQSPVISPSCAFQTLQFTPAEVGARVPSPSRRPKQLASNPARQHALVLDLNAYEGEQRFPLQSWCHTSVSPGIVENFRSNATKQKQPRLTARAPDVESEQCGVASMHPHPAGKGGDKLMPSRRRGNKTMCATGNTCRPKAGSVKRGRGKARTMTNNDLPTRSCKRPREASMDGHENGEQRIDEGVEDGPPFGERRNGSVARGVDFIFTSPPIPLTVEGTSFIQSFCFPAQDNSLKRRRVALETASAPPQMAEVREAQVHDIGARDIRPLPHRMSAKRAQNAVGDGTTGVHSGYWAGGSQEDVDRSLRDAAANALVVLRDEDRPTIPDWTRDEEPEEAGDLPPPDLSDVQEAVAVQNPVEEVAQDNITFKPRLLVPPRIWAQSRQEVCESLEHFRSYHGGVYSHKDIVKGYLLGAYAASRDVFHEGGKFIISHGGGRAESVLESRGGVRLQPAQDQDATDKSVRALLKNYKEGRPLVLIADDNYALFPYDLAASGYTYVVLGVYWISYAWAEYQPAPRDRGRITSWKNEALQPGRQRVQANYQESAVDNHFWNISGEEPQQLDYHQEFLKLVPNKFENLPSLLPPKTVPSPDLVTTTYPFSKGWHCERCGRLSSRTAAGSSGSTGNAPTAMGKIHLILGTPLANVDANTTFELYQQQAITGELQLRRYPLRNHKVRGSLLTNYFSQNSGEPYQARFCFEALYSSPEFIFICVRRALALIKERSGLAMAKDTPFNEILSAAYMERQKMSFHSDSEKGLGPVVASLSLGSAAAMHFRRHVSGQKHKNMSQNALTLILRHGDVLIMEGEGVQEYYEHTVIPMNFRIAATARCIGST